MHEVSIILNVLEIARQYCEKDGFSRIDLIKVRIGRASGVLSDALQFAFEVSKMDTPAAGASLVIEEIPVSALCNHCGRQFSKDEKYIFSCSLCGSDDFKILSGRELDIVELEVS
jgi:hydrogenase nickel incorporation protein HypA/HybF